MTNFVLDQEGKKIKIEFKEDLNGKETIMFIQVFQDGEWVIIMHHDITERV